MPSTAAQIKDLLDQYDLTRPLDWRARRFIGPAGQRLPPRAPDSACDPVPDADWVAVCDGPSAIAPEASTTILVRASEIAASPSWERAVLESWIISDA